MVGLLFMMPFLASCLPAVRVSNTVILAIPIHKARNALLHAGGGGEAGGGLQRAGVGRGGGHVAVLHGQEVFLRGFAQRVFQRGDVGHQLDGIVVADVEHAVRRPARGGVGLLFVKGRICLGRAVTDADDAFDDVVDVGEVALHFAVVEHVDRPSFEDRPGE